MKRIAFYLFFDKDGLVDDYIIHKLSAMNEFVDRIVFISNSDIQNESRGKLKPVVNDVFLRKNIGFDVWGYKEGIEFVGEDLKDYDEAIFLNYTFFAPIFPFVELFEWSENDNLDFWGITDHKAVTPNPFTGMGTLPRHIQSHFIAVKKKLLHSEDFNDYWNDMPMINSYQDSILNHESKFTEHFSKKGYAYDVYCNSDDYSSDYPSFLDINTTIKNRCPIIKRRPFFHDPLWIDRNAIDLRETLNLVRDISDYNPELIYKNLLRTTKPKDLATNISLLKIFDSSSEQKTRDDLNIAVLAHVYYPDMIMEMLEQVENIPNKYDLYITTASKENKIIIEDFLNHSSSHFSKFEVRVVEHNRGRDISALLITCRDIILDGNYDLICRLHSKKSPQNNPNQSLHFKKQMYDNLVYDRAYTSKLINFIDGDEEIGFLAPPMVHIGYPTLGHSWFTNKLGAEQIAKRLDIKIPFDDFSPFAAYGTMFWFRPNSLKRLFEENWRWEEFNKEPGHNDGSLSHIIERLLIYVVHDSGYKCFNVMSTDMAEYNYTKLEYKTQRIMSNLPNGLVQDQCNILQSQLSVSDSYFPLHRKVVRLVKYHTAAYHPALAAKLVKPYRVMVRLYLSVLGKIK
jgi:lipopolysaccharide biosynthesis protein